MKIMARLIALTAALAASPAFAQVSSGLPPEIQTQANNLGQCMVGRTTGEDRIAIAGWMVAAMASAPQLNGIAAVTPERKEALDRGMARIFTRLMTTDCTAEARALFATRNQLAFQAAGGPLGEIAMRELMGNPAALAALGNYVSYLKEEDFRDVLPPRP